MKAVRLTTLLLFCLSAGLASAQEPKLYRWVDENGVVHYGDSIPARYAELERQVVNEHGAFPASHVYVGTLRSSGARPEPGDPTSVALPLSPTERR